jgi:D-glycero-alpha-D-manno-heptose-7-phosphate kinase
MPNIEEYYQAILMIITKTPVRISFLGGGTDLPEFCNTYPSRVLSAAIDKYITVILKKSFDGKNRICYSRIELTDKVNEIEHDLIRVCLDHFGVNGVEVITSADVPGRGTGLGSSSALCVGLVHALMRMCTGNEFNPNIYAQLAYELERKAGHPVGLQDHFACACGGLKEYRFYNGEYQEINTFIPRYKLDEMFNNHIMLFYTGIGHDANELLKGQVKNIEDNKFLLKDMCKYAEIGMHKINNMEWKEFGDLIMKSWNIKASLADGITNDEIDEWILKGMKTGAYGAKLCGAGAGGFLLFITPLYSRDKIASELGLQEMTVKLSHEGTKTIYADS